MKICFECKIEKDLSSFSKKKTGRLGLEARCRLCRNAYKSLPHIRERSNELQRIRGQSPRVKEYNKKYREQYKKTQKGKERISDYFLKKLYGITIDQYKQMFESQQGRCSICNTHQDKLNRSLCVDHNHETGKVRELLCHHCNTAIGAFKEDEELIMKAISYLKRFKKERLKLINVNA